jgi:hypothetical protein
LSDGVKLTISGIGNGLTVDKNGRPLLPVPFVFQCSPLEEFSIVHAFNFGTYDTIDDDQFVRRGSRQLDTWAFDTMAMYLGDDGYGNHRPAWVPYPTRESSGSQYQRPEWYRDQLWALFDAGSPFKFAAHFKHSTTIRRTFAVLTAFNEVYKHGEGDTIYFQGVSFQEWRDPRGQTVPSRGTLRLPAHVRFRSIGGHYIAYDTATNRNIPHAKAASTLADLAHFYYGDASKWRQIATANHLKGGGSTSYIFSRWYPHRLSSGKPNVTMVVPRKK